MPDLAHLLAQSSERSGSEPMDRVDADMAYLLDILKNLGARPVEHCSITQARRQPTLAGAVAELLKVQGREQDADESVAIEDIAIPSETGEIAARIYRPAGAQKPFLGQPMILYIHGGGWVIGDLDAYDASPRALAQRTGAIVISAHYRLAPEHKFPAAHDDTITAWRWVTDNARALGGDPRNVALVGESVGGNMAMNIALYARDNGTIRPVHQVLIYPVAGTDMGRQSYTENMRSRPLNTFTMRWFVRQALGTREDAADPRLNLVSRNDLAGLPPTTIILAEIDPLRTEGEELAEALEQAGVPVQAITYNGVTHEFFGLGKFVNKAMFAQAQVANDLSAAFSRRNRRF